MTANEVLQQCRVEGLVIKLPAEQLERKLYMEVQKKLELIGGKWKGGKVGGFVFEEDPTDLLAEVANGDDRNLKKEYQFFPTPPDIAQQMVSYLPLVTPDYKVLEPSAGDGALIKAFRQVYLNHVVDCFELMDINRKKLEKVEGAKLIGTDFLGWVDASKAIHDYYDIILANPPFTKNQDIDHIRAMWKCLKPGGTIITLASPSWVTGSQKKQVEFREWLESMDVFPLTLPQGSFAASGTMIAPVLLQIKKPQITFAQIGEEYRRISEASEQNEEPVRRCRVCHCTDDDCSQCVEKTGEPCHWVADDLCSACNIDPTPQEVEAIVAKHTEPSNEDRFKIEISDETDGLRIVPYTEPSNNDTMNFFQSIYDQLDGIDVTLKLRRVNGLLSVDVLPQAGGTIKPANVTGTPEELDEGFFQVVSAPIAQAKGLKLKMDDFHKTLTSLEADTKAKLEEAEKANKSAAKKAGEKKKEEPMPAPAPKAKEQKKTEVIEEPSLFGEL